MQGRKAETIKEQIRHHDLGCNNCIYIEHNLSTGLYTTLRILKIQYLRVLKGILHKIDKGFIHRKNIYSSYRHFVLFPQYLSSAID